MQTHIMKLFLNVKDWKTLQAWNIFVRATLEKGEKPFLYLEWVSYSLIVMPENLVEHNWGFFHGPLI